MVFLISGTVRRQRYRRFLWDDNEPVPARTKVRRAKRARLAQEDESDGTDSSCDRSVNFCSGYVTDGDEPPDSDESREGDLSADHKTDIREDVCDVGGQQSTEVTDFDLPSDAGDVLSHLTSARIDQDLYPCAGLAKGESLLLIMGHCLRHHSSKEATESLIKLLELHLPAATTIPTSKYPFLMSFLQLREGKSFASTARSA